MPSVLDLADVITSFKNPSLALATNASMLTQFDVVILITDGDLQTDEFFIFETISYLLDSHAWRPLLPQDFTIVDVAATSAIIDFMNSSDLVAI